MSPYDSVSAGVRDAPSTAAENVAEDEYRDGRSEGWSVCTFRPSPHATLFDVQLSEYHEYFLVAVGEKSVSVTMLDRSDATYPEPQTFVFAKPYGWDETLEGDEALLQVWQSVGVLR